MSWLLGIVAVWLAAGALYAEWQLRSGAFEAFRRLAPDACRGRGWHYRITVLLWPVLGAIDFSATAVVWWHGGWPAVRAYWNWSCGKEP